MLKMMKSNTDIRQDIDAALRAWPNIEPDISVMVNGGVVLLVGYVHDLSHKYTAEDIVKARRGRHRHCQPSVVMGGADRAAKTGVCA
jgi:osmotically-inducible protein OsmY